MAMTTQFHQPQRSTPFGPTLADGKTHEAVVELGEEELASVSGGAPWLLVGAVLLLWPR